MLAQNQITKFHKISLSLRICHLYIAKPSQVPLPQQEIAKLNNYKERLLEAVHVMV